MRGRFIKAEDSLQKGRSGGGDYSLRIYLIKEKIGKIKIKEPERQSDEGLPLVVVIVQKRRTDAGEDS